MPLIALSSLFSLIIVYFLMSGPLTYGGMCFISWFVRKHRSVLEEGLSAEDRRSLIDEMIDPDPRMSPYALLIAGWLLFPICILMALFIIGWYIRKVASRFSS